jgi:hypothetical protein
VPTCQDLAGFWDMVHIQVTPHTQTQTCLLIRIDPYSKHGSGAGVKLQGNF